MTAAATLSSTATFRAKALARENLDMVDTCLRITRARFHDLPSDDTLRGVGTEALWRAARRYDASKGASFSTYASRRVIGSMRDTRRRPYRSRDALDARPPASQGTDRPELDDVHGDTTAASTDELAERRRQVALLLERADGVVGTGTWTIVVEHAVRDRSLRELARSLGTSFRQVRSRYARGLERLREVMGVG